MQEEKMTPMMAQWDACKKKIGNAVLFFRMGDFYEAFYEDAKITSEVLELTLTKRQEIPMSGVPAHAVDAYLDKLVSKGYSVALAEQLEDPKKTKGIVKRDVVRLISPGTLVSSNLLKDKSNNYFVSVAQVGKIYGIAAFDLSCNEFKTTEVLTVDELLSELNRLNPKELLISEKVKRLIKWEQECSINVIDEWLFDHSFSYQFLKDHFKVKTLDGFGLQSKTAAICASGALLNHIKLKHLYPLEYLNKLIAYHPSETLYIDKATEENLNLVSGKNSLLSILDKTKTAMGARLLYDWVLRPLLNIDEILNRQSAIKSFLYNRDRIVRIQDALSSIKDIERLSSKVSLGQTNPKDLLTLALSLEAALTLKPLLEGLLPLKSAADKIVDLNGVSNKIIRSLKQPPPLRLSDGDVIADHVDSRLDEYRQISHNTKNFLIEYQNKIKDETQIRTLKVGYTRLFGYYIEVSRGQTHLVPAHFERRQTLANQERYVTPELREFEQKVLEAEDKIQNLESEIFNGLIQSLLPYQEAVFEMAKGIAEIDTLLSLAVTAEQNKFVAPMVNLSHEIVIKDGRHPVIESLLPQGGFVANDTEMDDKNNRMFVITGPNMAGKSTYIRQVALIVLMAQMGSFVPAREVNLGLIDRIFTRIGASDDLGRGQSTFMKEMAETANILNNLTDRSLVILDEIGRGTSTYDGISIAWSCAEYLLGQTGKNAKTLFATHYFELTKLENEIPGAKNYHSAIRETPEGIYFLRKIVPGGTDRSYGIHVAKLAGIPLTVIQRAHEILKHLEETSNRKQLFQAPKKPKKVKEFQTVEVDEQLLLF
jgi:DNA mismatch repair protein MutS